MSVQDGKVSSAAPSCSTSPAQPMTIWYKAPSSWSKVSAYYRVDSSPNIVREGVAMSEACDGWWKLTVPDTKGARVKASFTNGRDWDGNGKKADGSLNGYWASGDSMAVSGGQVIGDVTPNCATSKQ